MKYTYKNKKTYKLKNKLRILLTILLAALISTTGYIISKNAFSIPTDNGLVFVEENSRGYTITITADNLYLPDVELYDGSNNLIGTTNSLGVIDYSDANLPVLDYLIIDNNTITLNQEDPNNYTFSYTIPLVGEAYAEFDSSTKQLRIFRDIAGLYTNGQVIGTKTYYTGIETISGNTYPKWDIQNSYIESIVFEDYFRPKTAYGMFYSCSKLTSITGMNKFITSDVTTMYRMFAGCSVLSTLDVSNFDTSNVTNMEYMFSDCKKITQLNLSSFNTSNVDDMDYMFYYSDSLTSLDLSSFNTSNAITIEGLFCDCTDLTEVNLSSFDTRNVEVMAYLFCGCYKLKSIDLSDFDTSNVYDMDYMFSECRSLTSLDLSNFDTSGVSNMQSVFDGCSSLKNLDLSNFDTYQVINMSWMFSGCSSLTSLNLDNFYTYEVGDFSNMFSGCTNLRVLDISNFDTANAGAMDYMFENTPKLYILSLGYNWQFIDPTGLEYSWKNEWDNTVYTAAELTSSYDGSTMSGIYRRVDFYNAIIYDSGNMVFQEGSTPDTSLGNVNATYTGFDLVEYSNSSSVPWYNNRTSVTTVTFKDYILPYSTAYWFYGMTNLTKFNKLSNLDTSYVTSTKSMFENCTKLTSFNLNNIEATYLYVMDSMFKGCTNLQSLNVSNFKARELYDVTDIFANTNLKTLTLGDQTYFNVLPTLSGTWKRDGSSTTYTGNQVFSGPAGIYRLQGRDVYAIVYDNGEMVFQEGNTPDPTKGNVLGTYSGFETRSYTFDQIPWYSNRESITKVIFEAEISPISTKLWFNGMSNLTEIENIELLDISNVTNMQYLFSNCSSLTNLDLSSFDTSNVTDMTEVFYKCTNLINLDISNFITDQVTTMTRMFYECNSLTSLDVSSFDTSNVTEMIQMFSGCSSITSIDVSNFDTYKVTRMSGMFQNCSNLVNLDLSNFYTTNIISLSDMFRRCHNLTSLDISSFDTSNVTYMGYMFYECKKLNSIDVSNFDTSKVTNMCYMFYDCENLVNLDLSNFDTSEVLYMYNMFTGCEHLASLDVSSFDTSNVISMSSMFGHCSSLVSLDVSSFNTSKVTDIGYMFASCSSLTSLDLSGFDTSKATSLSNMFYFCEELITLDLSSFNTTNVRNLDSMVEYCSNLKSLDISSFNTSNVTSMQNMFNATPNLKILKLGTNWNFLSNNKLTKSWIRDGDTTIYTATELTNSYNGSTMAGTYRVVSEAYAEFDSSNGQLRIFRDTQGLYTNGQVSGTKTYYTGIETITGATDPRWYSNKSNITTVVIEDYFRPKTAYSMFYGCNNLLSITNIEKLITNNVTTMYGMFKNCSNLSVLDLSGFDTSNVTHMDYMFESCSSLTSLDLSNFDTSNVTDMDNMFIHCDGLITLDVSNFNTINVTDMSYMFYDCSTLTNINVSSFNTSKVTKMSFMFWCCNSLTSLDLSNFNTSRVTDMSYMFGNCEDLTTLDFSGWDTSNVTTMSNMFDNCDSLTSLDLTDFDTTSLNYMSYMFVSCDNLTSLNLSSFNTSSVLGMNSAFSSTKKLNTLILGTNWKFLSNNGLANSWKRDGDTTVYTAAELTSSYNGSTMAGTYRVMPEAYAEFDSSTGILRIFQAPPATYTNEQTIDTKTYYTEIEMITGNTYPKWYSIRSNITSVVIEDEFKPKTGYYMFSTCTNLTTITGMSNLDTSNMTTMSHMFYHCNNLISLDVSNFNTSNVTSMNYMFYNCDDLSTLNVSNWSSNNVTDMSNMFGGCIYLTALDLSNFNTSNVTTMQNMFYNTRKLNTLILGSNWSFLSSNSLSNSWKRDGDTTVYTADQLTANYNGSTMAGTYRAQPELFAEFDSSTGTLRIFKDTVGKYSNNQVIDTKTYYTGLESIYYNSQPKWYSKNTSITNVVIEEEFKPKTAYNMFQACSNLTTITGIENLDTSEVTTMYRMFSGCIKLETLDISNFDSTNVTNMQNMFNGTSKLNTLILGTNWNFLSDNGLSGLWRKDGDGNLYTADQLTSSYDGSTMADTYRAMVQLTIEEEVRGNLADINKDFDFVISVEKDGVGIDGIYGALLFINGEAAFVLNHDVPSISVYLPRGYSYNIVENPDGYTLSSSYASGTLSEDKTARFINTLNGTTPTGILIDLIPFIILITCGVFGVLWIKKFKYI